MDRDIFLRFRGGGIGHKTTWNLNEELMKDIPDEIRVAAPQALEETEENQLEALDGNEAHTDTDEDSHTIEATEESGSEGDVDEREDDSDEGPGYNF